MSFCSKSERFYNCAEYLSNTKHFENAAHSGYYSTYQILKEIIQTEGLTETEYVSYEGSHNLDIKLVYEHLLKSDKRKARDFQREINEMKWVRTQADYKPQEVPKTKVIELLNLAYQWNQFLKEKYDL